MEAISQRHREAAAAAIRGDDEQTVRIRALIVAGERDEHPAVQAAAFYECSPDKR